MRRATEHRARGQPLAVISIHALLAESDHQDYIKQCTKAAFLSTLSLRRATDCLTGSHYCEPYFYPRSPCGERRLKPRDEWVCVEFLSTLSLRRATLRSPNPRLTGDNFYPRSPCGERLVTVAPSFAVLTFLSTLSLRRATGGNRPPCPAGGNFYPRSPCGERLANVRSP